MSSSLQVGLRCARLCAFRGLLLRWLLLLCHSRHGRRPGPQKTTQQQHKRAASLGWGFAALAAGLPGCCCGGSCCCCRATRTEDLCRTTRTEDLCRTTRTEDLCRATRTEDLCRATRTEDLCRATRTEDSSVRFRFSSVRFRFHLPPPPGSLLIITPDYGY